MKSQFRAQSKKLLNTSVLTAETMIDMVKCKVDAIADSITESVGSIERRASNASFKVTNSHLIDLLCSKPTWSRFNDLEQIAIEKVENVKLMDRMANNVTVVGTLFLTDTHLIFTDARCRHEKWIVYSQIASAEKLPLTAQGCPFRIRCKTFHILTLVLPRERVCIEVLTAIKKLSQPERIDDLYAFKYKNLEIPSKSLGWNFFDLESEYLRMGVPNAHWTKSLANANYELCDTYPSSIYVPTCAKHVQVLGSSKFRSRGRLPVLSYLHRDNQAAISRCSQPLAGFSARCVEDEELLQCIYEANPTSKELFVVDTRPMINAMANRAAGKGYEDERLYSNIKFQFVGIANIHIMRASLQKLIEVSDMKMPTMSSYMKALDESNWLKHIRTVLETSVFIANKIQEGTSVLVHCSDGWDRTAQTCSLASMMLDPHYRTIQGFQALIEKEWLSFGHKFNDRCRHISVVDTKEQSPVFTQFLDATWQMMTQFPTSFQFNERFLLTLHDHLYSSQFGTFLGNCEKDRVDLRLSERTYSLWGYVASDITDFVNPLYRKDLEVDKSFLIPNVAPQFISYWKGMYNRFDATVHERENVTDVLSALTDHNSSLEDHIKLLERRVQELGRLLGRPVAAISQKLQGLLSAESIHCLSSLLESDLSQSSTLNDHDTPISILNDGMESGDGNKLEDNSDDKESGFDDGSSLSKSHMMSDSIIRADGLDNVTLDQIYQEMDSVAINLKTLRNRLQCSCSLPFQHYSKRYHCWKCGNVFCSKCILRHTPLAGHYSQKPVPICKDCYKVIRNTKSMSSLQKYCDEQLSVTDNPSSLSSDTLDSVAS